MALCPFIDLFNHADERVSASIPYVPLESQLSANMLSLSGTGGSPSSVTRTSPIYWLPSRPHYILLTVSIAVGMSFSCHMEAIATTCSWWNVYSCRVVCRNILLNHVIDGFILERNKWDTLQLDDLLLPLLTSETIKSLADAGYLGQVYHKAETSCMFNSR